MTSLGVGPHRRAPGFDPTLIAAIKQIVRTIECHGARVSGGPKVPTRAVGGF